MTENRNIPAVKYSILFLMLLILILCCEKEENKDNTPALPDTPSNDTIPIPEPQDTLCLEGVFYDLDCYDDSVLTAWGIGTTEDYYISNEREYSWYIDQALTGEDSQNNCGPSCVTMAALWYYPTYSLTAADARDMYPLGGGWWYTNNITDFLDFFSIPYELFEFEDDEQIEANIEDGNIIILCVSTSQIRYNPNRSERVDRFYEYVGGHFLVVKGVRSIDGNVFLEVYDPNTWYKLYNDSTPKGKNRHYRATDISNAVTKWWDYLIVVYPNKRSLKNADSAYNRVDPDKIPHAWGK